MRLKKPAGIKCDRCKRGASTGSPFFSEGWVKTSVGELCPYCCGELQKVRISVAEFESEQMRMFWACVNSGSLDIAHRKGKS
jgi:hypothetical protein